MVESIIHLHDDMHRNSLSLGVPYIVGVGSGAIAMYKPHIEVFKSFTILTNMKQVNLEPYILKDHWAEFGRR